MQLAGCVHLRYYEWRDRVESVTATRRAELGELVQKSYDDSEQTYGHRRVHAQLLRWGQRCTPELIRRIMRGLGLNPCQPRPRRSLTQADPVAGPIPDLVNRDFTAHAPGQKMVGDVTYIPTWEGWLYLATVIDCHTKAVIGYATDDNYKTPLIEDAIHMAARNYPCETGAIFHSDRGSNGGFNRSSQHQCCGGNIAHRAAFQWGFSSRVLCGVGC